MIHIVLGKPGSGKSRYAVGKLVEELRETERNIVTNLPLDVGRLNEYLQERYPDEDLRLMQRLRMLTDEELSSFWLFRGPGKDGVGYIPEDLPPFVYEYDDSRPWEVQIEERQKAFRMYEEALEERYTEQKEAVLALGDVDGKKGVAYLLDEAHIAFNARDWAKLGRAALFYMSQHRKLNDNVYPITQACGNLDKQFRSVAQDYTVLRNEYISKLGPFKGRGRFVAKSYYEEPSRNSEPFHTDPFELDPEGLASCYKTAEGVGIKGTTADKGARAKGWSIWWIFPIFGVLALGVVAVPYALGKVASGAIAGVNDFEAVVDSVPGTEADVLPSELPLERVRVVGLMLMGGEARIWLSDGSRFSSLKDPVEWASRDKVVISGITYNW